jgi:hypothetical protein
LAIVAAKSTVLSLSVGKMIRVAAIAVRKVGNDDQSPIVTNDSLLQTKLAMNERTTMVKPGTAASMLLRAGAILNKLLRRDSTWSFLVAIQYYM